MPFMRTLAVMGLGGVGAAQGKVTFRSFGMLDQGMMTGFNGTEVPPPNATFFEYSIGGGFRKKACWTYYFELDGDFAGETYNYHLHEGWTGYDCQIKNTGGHWDPEAKCGGASGADCPADSGDIYQCSDTNLGGCEAGDLSSMVGKAIGVAANDGKTVFENTHCVPLKGWFSSGVEGVSAKDYEQPDTKTGTPDLGNTFASIVFHKCKEGSCGPRAFCMPLFKK